jgi:hypothetical protein
MLPITKTAPPYFEALHDHISGYAGKPCRLSTFWRRFADFLPKFAPATQLALASQPIFYEKFTELLLFEKPWPVF